MASKDRQTMEKLFDMSEHDIGTPETREQLKFELLLDIRDILSALYEEAQKPAIQPFR